MELRQGASFFLVQNNASDFSQSLPELVKRKPSLKVNISFQNKQGNHRYDILRATNSGKVQRAAKIPENYFCELENSFYIVPIPAKWQVIRRYGSPKKFTAIIEALHNGMTGRVQHQSGLLGPFPITGELQHGCLLSPTLFSIYLAVILQEIPDTLDPRNSE